MGNICFRPAQADYDSNLNSPVAVATTHHQSGPSSHASRAANAIGINDIPMAERELFLTYNDPVRSLGLTPETKVYRTVAAKYIVDGMLQGHCDAHASIYNHERLVPNPYAAMRTAGGTKPPAYKPLKMLAKDLSVPMMNVMAGAEAINGTRPYRGDGKVTVEMTLNHFLERGGKVYNDASSLYDTDQSAALILTMPNDFSVPVTILE